MNESDRVMESSQLIDWACIDLIERNRRGEPVRVEEYLDKYPHLLADQYTLDLIDAEICIRKELGKAFDDGEWLKRFPQYSLAIGQLLALDEPPPSTALSCDSSLHDTSPTVVVSSSQSDDSIAYVESLRMIDEVPAPIPLPSGFIADGLVASSPGRWLIRCRDTSDRRHYAFKVIETVLLGVPRLTAQQRTDLLNACERSVLVQHPAWVRPVIATCDGQYLGVVRPWCHATSWTNVVTSLSTQRSLRLLSEIAFCLHAAHRVGCYHGKVSESNLFIDHNHSLRLTDAVISTSLSAIPEQCVRNDELSVLKLLATLQLDPNRGLSPGLLQHGQRLLNKNAGEPLPVIGEWLIRQADAADSQENLAAPTKIRSTGMRFIKSFFSGRNSDNSTSFPHNND